MTNNSPFPVTWHNLPDPRPSGAEGATTVVEVRKADWRKVVQKHFASSKEPWGDTLGEDIRQALLQGSNSEATRRALELLRRQCDATMTRPLVILYSCIRAGHRGQGHRWLLLLPCGAVGVVWVEKPKNYLKTCYFTGAVGVKPKRGRWRHALRQQVQEYANYDEQTRKYCYPAKNDRREVSVVGATNEIRYAIQFNAADAWGFSSNTPGSPWSPPRWNWESVELSEASANVKVFNEGAR